MKRIGSILLFIALVVLILTGLFSYETNNVSKNYSIKKMNGKYDQALKMAQNANRLEDLNKYIDRIEYFQKNAEACVKESQAEIIQLNDIIQSSQAVKNDVVTEKPDATPAKTVSGPVSSHKDVTYLKVKQQEQRTRLSQCRLFLYQSQEALVELKQKEQALSKNVLLKKSSSILTLIKQVDIKQDGLSTDKVQFIADIQSVDMMQHFFMFFVLLAGVVVAYMLRKSLRQYASSKQSIELDRIVLALSPYFYGLITFAFLSLYAFIGKQFVASFFDFGGIFYVLLTFFLLMAFSKYVFYPGKDVPGPFEISNHSGRSLYALSGAVIVLGAAGYLISYTEILSLLFRATDELFGIVFIFLLSTMWFVFLYRFLKVFKLEKNGQISTTSYYLLQMSLFATYLIILVLELVGYHAVAVYLLKGLFFTSVYYALVKIAWLLSSTAADFVNSSKHVLTFKIKRFFGVKYINKIPEVAIIHWAINILILFGFLTVTLYVWDVSENFIDHFIKIFVDGFKIYGVHVVPMELLTALLIFSIVLLVGRSISAHVARKQNFQGDDDAQVAVATILLYVSFAVAVLFGLFALKIDFTGIAIVAGALSVGIGLGLQTIVNNFISGLILLIEKPIKPGDRIVVDGVEGFVKKVRIRSTQISTMLREDVIVPNADLITHQVTNYMFRDKYWRVACPVGVAYGSDIELVHEVMMQVANEHPDVLKDAPNEPVVLFRQFADSSLNFELWCVIDDVNKKFIVVSELLAAIDKAFRAHKITIAFPQRDIHIKSGVSNVLPSESSRE